jgi:hypothetical protein
MKTVKKGGCEVCLQGMVDNARNKMSNWIGTREVSLQGMVAQCFIEHFIHRCEIKRGQFREESRPKLHKPPMLNRILDGSNRRNQALGSGKVCFGLCVELEESSLLLDGSGRVMCMKFALIVIEKTADSCRSLGLQHISIIVWCFSEAQE